MYSGIKMFGFLTRARFLVSCLGRLQSDGSKRGNWKWSGDCWDRILMCRQLEDESRYMRLAEASPYFSVLKTFDNKT